MVLRHLQYDYTTLYKLPMNKIFHLRCFSLSHDAQYSHASLNDGDAFWEMRR